MKDFFKYLTAGEVDKKWGLYLNVAGKSAIAPGSTYPPAEHPTGYYYTWENGRTLNEYQINYITEGSGILENIKGKFDVRSGSLMIIRKGEWHRYKPDKGQGWQEHYIGFDGLFAKHFLQDNRILHGQSVIHCNIREDLIDTYYKIFDLAQMEEPGFQQIASGLVIKLLGYIVAFEKQRDFSGKKVEEAIRRARFFMRENVAEEINLEKLAAEHNIGYSYFRKMFKQYTGISPRKYHLELKIMRAKEQLLASDKTIKEICYELGFQSEHYFSRFFKQKVGINPSDLRK
jgi:AraC-like DNA-binding protein